MKLNACNFLKAKILPSIILLVLIYFYQETLLNEQLIARTVRQNFYSQYFSKAFLFQNNIPEHESVFRIFIKSKNNWVCGVQPNSVHAYKFSFFYQPNLAQVEPIKNFLFKKRTITWGLLIKRYWLSLINVSPVDIEGISECARLCFLCLVPLKRE